MDHIVSAARVFDAVRQRRRAPRTSTSKPQAGRFFSFAHACQWRIYGYLLVDLRNFRFLIFGIRFRQTTNPKTITIKM